MCNPAFAISSLKMLSASFNIVNLSSVMSPITRIARPGPGKGCLKTKFSGIPSSNPVFLTSSLNKSRKGSIISLKST